MNRYFWALLIVVAVVAVGITFLQDLQKPSATIKKEDASSETEKTPAAAASLPSVTTLVPGASSGGMRILSIEPFSAEYGPMEPGNVKAAFTGTVTVEGEYDYYFSEFDGDWWLSFTPATTSTELPQVEERADTFYFTNQEVAERLFGITQGTPAHGAARIRVEGYRLNSYPSEVLDRTTILSVE